MRTRSIAPGAARWPAEIWAPSNAGPGRARRGEQPVREPSTISAFVPTSTMSVHLVGEIRRLGEDHARGVGADVPGDARQHVDAGALVRRELQLRARTRTAASVASANGAEPSGTGSMPSRR